MTYDLCFAMLACVACFACFALLCFALLALLALIALLALLAGGTARRAGGTGQSRPGEPPGLGNTACPLEIDSKNLYRQSLVRE